jgi:hypothetical protein
MGTIGSWISVILVGGALGVVSALLNIKPAFINSAAWVKALFILTFAAVGLFMGMVLTFGWNAFHLPLVLPTVVAFAGFLIASWYLRRIGIIR